VLTELHIEALGVIDRATLLLGPGLTALTGETGAGKTMLIEAIELLVGGRADPSIVRPGASEARIDGRLVVGDDEFVLTRVVPADGRSRAYINDRPATASALDELTTGLVSLHGQHAHQALLSAGAQRDALDLFAGVDLGPLHRARASITEIEAELATLGGDERARAREIDLLRYQVAELDEAAIVDGDEDDALDREEDLLADAQAHREAAAAAHAAIVDDRGGRDAIAAALAALSGRAPFDEISSRLAAVAADLDDVAVELRSTGEAIDDDPERLDAIRGRRQLLADLRRKYGSDLAEVIEFHRRAESRLGELERFEERAAELDAERAAALRAHDAVAARIGAVRRAAAPELAAAVEVRLRELAMPHASVVVDVGDDDPAGSQVRYLLAANPGSPLLPLARVASGGELARAMLALRLALSGVDENTTKQITLVFDEVDAGIGGAAASAVGDALAALGRHHQVLVVTHLAQVAAKATTQIAIDKRVANGETTATAGSVDGDGRVAEIARMLSGSPDSASAREHAAELLGH
jgi:DNA repair protein RecN (Recombination protein N)